MSTFRAAKDPGAQYERQFAKWQDYMANAENAESQGRTASAAMWRRKAHGVRSAMTRLAKREGWL